MAEQQNVGDLGVDLSLNVDQLRFQVARAKGLIDGLEGAFGGFARGAITSLTTTLAALAGPAALIAVTKRSLEVVDSMEKLSFRINSAVGDLQTLAYVGDLAGISGQQLARSMDILNRRLAEAARTGEGPTADALRRVQIEAKTLLALPVDQRIALLADQFDKLGFTTAQQAEALRNFGLRGSELVEVMAGGSKSIAKARKDLEDFGVILDRVDAQKVVQANDAFTTANKVLEGVGNQIAIRVSPLLKQLADDFANAARESKGFGSVVDVVIGALLKEAAHIQEGWGQVQIMWDELVASVLDGINAMIRGWNAFDEFFVKWFGGSKSAVAEIQHSYGKLREHLGQAPDYETSWKLWWDRLQFDAKKSAEEEAAAREAIQKRGGAKLDPLSSEQRKQMQERLDTLRAQLQGEDMVLAQHRNKQLADIAEFQQKLGLTEAQARELRVLAETEYLTKLNELKWSKLQEGIATENEILAKKYADQLKMIDDFEKNRTLTETQAAELRKKYADKFALDALQLQARQYSGLASIVDTAMGQISQVIGKEGGAAFEIMKAISMATALVKGYEAVVSAFAAGNAIGGPPVGAAFAAIAAAGVAAQIAALASTKPQGAAGGVGGGGGGAFGAATPLAATGATAGPRSGQTMYVEGFDPTHFYSGAAAERLSREIVQWERDGGKAVMR